MHAPLARCFLIGEDLHDLIRELLLVLIRNGRVFENLADEMINVPGNLVVVNAHFRIAMQLVRDILMIERVIQTRRLLACAFVVFLDDVERPGFFDVALLENPIILDSHLITPFHHRRENRETYHSEKNDESICKHVVSFLPIYPFQQYHNRIIETLF